MPYGALQDSSRHPSLYGLASEQWRVEGDVRMSIGSKLWYGIRNDPHGRSNKHTEYLTNGSGDRGTTFRYPDGCLTIYQHQDGRVSGYHTHPNGDIWGSRFDVREGKGGPKHPHHPEGQKGAQRLEDRRQASASFLGQLAIAWDRALRWNRLR
jgi:hypothetical protein